MIKTILIVALLAGFSTLAGLAYAQQPAPNTADVRALQSTSTELLQAWTGARAQMLAAQDQIAQLQQENQRLKTQIATMEAEKAKALPSPGSKPAEPTTTQGAAPK